MIRQLWLRACERFWWYMYCAGGYICRGCYSRGSPMLLWLTGKMVDSYHARSRVEFEEWLALRG